MKRIFEWPLIQLIVGCAALVAVFLGLQAATAALLLYAARRRGQWMPLRLQLARRYVLPAPV